jgi:ATP-binding cassette subfamily C (CFTR/MRP) protein 4
MRLGWNLRIGFTAFLHEHMLTLPTAVVNTFGTGRVVNLISTDVLRFDIATMAVHFAWTTPLEVLVASSLIVNTVGWAAGMAGVGVVLLSMVILLFFGKRFAARRKKTAAYTDQRVTSTQVTEQPSLSACFVADCFDRPTVHVSLLWG